MVFDEQPTAWVTRVPYIIDIKDYRTQPITWADLEAYLAEQPDTTWDSVKVYKRYKTGNEITRDVVYEWPGEYHYEWLDNWHYFGKRWTWCIKTQPKTLQGLMAWRRGR